MAISVDTLFSLLGDETRRRIVVLLARHGELCVCELVAALDMVQPRVSTHLAKLRKAGVLRARKQGLWVHYALHPELPGWARQVIAGLRQGARAEPYAMDERRLAQRACATPAGQGE